MGELSALDQLKVGVLDLSDRGQVAYANQAARGWLGRSPLGSEFSELLSGGSRLFFLNHLYPLLHSGQDLEEAYLSLLDAQGQELPVLLNGSGLEGGQKRLTFMPIRRRAIIERQLLQAKQEAEEAMRAEQLTLDRLKEAQAQLVLQDRLAVMGTLAAGVAHELNNPLAYVMGNLELLQGANLDEEELLGLEDIREGIGRIHGIVTSLKVLSRGEEARKVPVDLNQMGQIACRLSSKEISCRCQLECEWSQTPLVVSGDEGKLTQVLLNLLLNACQAFVEADSMRNKIRLRTWLGNEEACLEIADNGPGIPAELRNRIFDPFFTTKPVGSGTGLGLSICQGILRSLGGRLELVASEQGACFRATLPLQTSGPRVGTASAPEAPELEGLRCLIIDDDPKVAKVLQRLLCRCECRVASGGLQGLQCLQQDDAYDLVLCDLMMPDVSGIEVYQGAPAHLQPLFLFVTGGVFTAEAESFLQEQQVPLLNKPFDREKLAAAVRGLPGMHSAIE